MVSKVANLVENIAKAITEKYSNKPTAPSLIISYVKNEWYTSILKYSGTFGKNKTVICSSRNNNLEKSLLNLSKKFLDICDESYSIYNLRKILCS